MLDDLVPPASVVPWSRGGLDARSVEEQAVAMWQKARRDAFMGFLIPSLICWMIWAATMFGGFPWPLFPTVGTAIPLLAMTVQKKDVIESNERRIVRRQEKELRRRQRRQLPPPIASRASATLVLFVLVVEEPLPARLGHDPTDVGRGNRSRRRSAGSARWRTPCPGRLRTRSPTSSRAGLRIVSSSSVRWWLTTLASSSTASSKAWVSVPFSSSTASSASWPSACSSSPWSASCSVIASLRRSFG